MAKVNKGEFGYIRFHKKTQGIKTAVLFLIPLALFLIGYITTKTKENYFTLIAILGCLPACKEMVNVLVFFKYHSISEKLFEELSRHTAGMESVYELILTTYDITCPVSCAVISGNEIAAYTEASGIP